MQSYIYYTETMYGTRSVYIGFICEYCYVKIFRFKQCKCFSGYICTNILVIKIVANKLSLEIQLYESDMQN